MSKEELEDDGPSAPPELELVAPVDEERRAKRAKAAAKRRRMKKLKAADLDERQLEELDGILERKESKASESEQSEPVEALPSEVQEQLAALANLSTADLVSTFWNSINTVFLEGTPNELNAAKKKLLVEAWVPVADKYLPAIAAGPEAGAVLVTLVVFSGPILARIKKKPNPVEEAEKRAAA